MCDLINVDLNSIAKTICQKENIINFDVEVVGGNKKGEGYLGQIEFVTIKDKQTKRTVNIVVKRAFQMAEIRKELPIRQSFLNEIYFYTKIWPKFQQFQMELGLKNVFDKVAHCYAVSSTAPHEMLALENIKEKGFILFDKSQVLTSDYYELIFEQYGRFHGLSYAYKEKYPEQFEKLQCNLEDIYTAFIDTKYFADVLKLLGELSHESLIPGDDDKIIKKFQNYRNDVVGIFRDSVKYKGKWGVILHGDCWSNNMMFKLENGKPVDMCLLDFQLSKLGSPAHDLSYCLYSGADKSIFDNLEKYLKIYYDSLKSFLKDCHYDSKILTFEELKEEWRLYAKFGFLMGVMLIRLKTQTGEDVKDLTDDLNLADSMKNTKCNEEEFKRRTRGLIQHLFEINAL